MKIDEEHLFWGTARGVLFKCQPSIICCWRSLWRCKKMAVCCWQEWHTNDHAHCHHSMHRRLTLSWWQAPYYIQLGSNETLFVERWMCVCVCSHLRMRERAFANRPQLCGRFLRWICALQIPRKCLEWIWLVDINACAMVKKTCLIV